MRDKKKKIEEFEAKLLIVVMQSISTQTHNNNEKVILNVKMAIDECYFMSVFYLKITKEIKMHVQNLTFSYAKEKYLFISLYNGK